MGKETTKIADLLRQTKERLEQSKKALHESALRIEDLQASIDASIHAKRQRKASSKSHRSVK